MDYAWSHAVISDETHRIITRTCNFSSDNTWSDDECSEAVAEVQKQYDEIDIYSLYTSVCIGDPARSYYLDSAQFKSNSHISSKRVSLYIIYNTSNYLMIVKNIIKRLYYKCLSKSFF